MATKVKLRTKAISINRESLYLDFYPPIPNPNTGKPTRREFLKLFLYEKARTPLDKQHNKETQALAENIKAQRQLDIQKGQYGFLSINNNADFVQYFKDLANKRKSSNYDNWISALHHLEKFTNGTLRFADLNQQFCNDFKEYLLTTKSIKSETATLSQNSAVSYFSKLIAAIKQAYKDGMLQFDLNAKIEAIKPEETHRQYLTLEEVQKLVNTDCRIPILKQAALFSCLTGLRHSDIAKLVWQEVRGSKQEGYYLQFIQQKTKGTETLPIPLQAYCLLGDRKEPNEIVFAGLKYSAWVNLRLKQWVMDAGITRDITFHSFRHTYATLQLNSGTDIFTVSKMLGHKDLKTTQVYAKIVDETKREATNRITLNMQ